MTIPLLDYAPSSQNHRVQGFLISSEETPKEFNNEVMVSNLDAGAVIYAAYRQIFNEQQMLEANRLKTQESQLRNGAITVRDFVRSLLLSGSFRQRNYDVSNNYRFVQMCFQRVLGRDVYSEQEKLSWSIVLATKGLNGFVNALLDSEEYLENFGEDVVPYQRRRILPQRMEGELPFARMPRYGADHRVQLEGLGYFQNTNIYKPFIAPPVWLGLVGKVITYAGASALTLLFIAVALAALEIISL
ncbi:MAG: phycobilisome rod-core linker polypeptide CpcG [Limnothrix sp. RL_2_0]|nr:phycobilisome rod-core linker polypeptide CpcG [Limnothrix sp. RL_2_0]